MEASIVFLVVLSIVTVWLAYERDKAKTFKKRAEAQRLELQEYEENRLNLIKEKLELAKLRDTFAAELLAEKQKNKEIISQKKSSETRLGQVTEHIVPFLENCRHDPKNMHFMGQPVDYIVFDFDQGEITFVEVKTGNAKESHRQKTIKNIIKAGKIFYETMRINEKGVTVKKQENQP